MGKSACGEKNGLRKGPWTAEEDQKLINYIQKHGKGKWRTLPKNAELKRCGKSCRLRWTNYLRPDIKRGKFSLEEEESIIQLHCVWGNRWSAIAARLPGRTDNEIKNYWNTRIKKRLLRMGIDPDTHNPLFHLLQLPSMLTSSQLNPSSLHALDPNLLSLPEFLFCQRKNPEIIPQNLQGNQLGYTQLIQNQFPSFPPNQLQIPIQEIQSSTSTNTIPLLDEAQFMQAKLQNFSPNLTNFSSQNSMPILWQNNGEAPNFLESFVPMQNSDYQYSNQSIIGPLSDNQMFISNKTGDIPDFSFMSTHLSPSSSTHTPLNTLSATCINGGAEEERDSYCSNMMMFGIPERLDFEGLGCVNTPEEFYH